MGGTPVAAFLSLALPRNLRQAWVDQFVKGLLKLGHSFNVSLAGGDTAQSPNGILADIVVVGSVPQGKAIRRSGARAGDRIYVTGALGGAAATLELLSDGKKLRPADYPGHFYPIPRVEVGRFLREKGLAAAMIDLSDGLSTDLGHICDESGVGAEIWVDAVPCAKIGKPTHKVDIQFALHGGDDYELLFAVPRKKLKRIPHSQNGTPITAIGEIKKERTLLLVDKAGREVPLPNLGWDPFLKPG
jgi:thiamine-monophosphate kinase